MPELQHLDRNVPARMADALRSFGYTVETARSLQMPRASDAEHLLHAAQHSRVLITKDKNFLALHAAWHLWPRVWGVMPLPEHAGILMISDHWPVQQAAQEVDQVLRSGRPPSNRPYKYELYADGTARWEHH